jgi:hypothetical protein
MNQMKRKARRLASLIASLCLMAGAANGCALMTGIQDKRDPNAPKAVTWDLSLNNDIKNLDSYAVRKFYRQGGEVMSYDDPIHLTLRLPGNRVFDEDLNGVLCWRNGSTGDRVRRVTAYFPFMNIEEVERTGNQLIERWKLERDNFDDWCRMRRGVIPEDDERLYGLFETVGDREENISLLLTIGHTRNGDRPWYIIWEVSWVSLDAK